MANLWSASLRSSILRLQRGTAADWIELDPILRSGEPGYEEDTGKFKIGDGESAWSGLPYASGSDVAAAIEDHDTSGTAHEDIRALIDDKADLVAGKLPASQLPTDVMEFKGVWNANANTPTLADGTGSPGDYYKVSVTGSRNLGSGPQDFVAGDAVILNASSVWERLKASTIASAVAVSAISGIVGTDVQAVLAEIRAQVLAVESGSGLPDGGEVGESVVNTGPGTGGWGVPGALTAHVAEPIGIAHPLVLPTAPPPLSGLVAVAAPGDGELPAGEYFYWAAAIFADGSFTDWNLPGAAVSITTVSTGGVTLSCDVMPGAVGYRWYGGLDNNGERYWDTVDPTYTDGDGTGGGSSYPERPQTTYQIPSAVPYARLDNFGAAFPPAPLVLADGVEAPVPFDRMYTTDLDRFELVPASGGTPAYLHIKLPGVYLITMQATAPDGVAWGRVAGRLAAVDFSNVLRESYHSGRILAAGTDGSGRSQLIVEKTVVTAGTENSQWTVFARLANVNSDGDPRSIGTVEMVVITLVR